MSEALRAMIEAPSPGDWWQHMVASVDQGDWSQALVHARQGHRLISDVFVMVALHGADWARIAERWAAAEDGCHDDPDYIVLGVLSLRSAGQPQRAAAVAAAGIRAFGEQRALGAELAQIAMQQGDAEESARRWDKLRRRFPEHAEAYVRGAVALQQAGRGAAAAALMDVARQRFQGDTAMQVLMGFESLGDNCEFGLVQRHFHAEPISLLRWSAIAATDLVKALESRFRQIDTKDYIRIDNDDGSYDICDRASGFSMHSFIGSSRAERDNFFEANYQHMRFLRDKLLRDLAGGEKIFVHKPRYGEISDGEIAAIHRGIRRYGAARLLCVRTTRDAAAVGTVTHAGDGLMIGLIDKVSPMADITEISFPCWLRICQSAKLLADCG
jgi:hypothetical protein